MTNTKSVRFSALVQKCGQPTVYLPLTAPDKDPEFMRAVKQDRVLSLKQQTTTKHKDFGVVGFLREKYVTYLVFPKPLHGFENARVVGIKYDVVQQAGVETGKAAPPVKNAIKRPTPKPTKVAKPQEPPRPKKPPKPQPKRFRVRVRVVVTSEKDVLMSAVGKQEAKKLAIQQVSKEESDESTVHVIEVVEERPR